MRYTEKQVRAAVRNATSWRQVNMRLGRSPDARTTKLREYVTELGIGTEHIKNPNARTYTDGQLAEAVKTAETWPQVARLLGKKSGASVKFMRQYAVGLGLDVSHVRSAPDRPKATPERDAEILHLNMVKGQSFAQIAKKFGLSPERVRQVVRREEQKLLIVRGKDNARKGKVANPRVRKLVS